MKEKIQFIYKLTSSLSVFFPCFIIHSSLAPPGSSFSIPSSPPPQLHQLTDCHKQKMPLQHTNFLSLSLSLSHKSLPLPAIEKSKSTDDASMASSSEACTSGIHSASLTDSSFKYAQLSLNKQTFCQINGYSLPSSSSGFGSSVSGSSSPQLNSFNEVSARSRKGRFERQTTSPSPSPSVVMGQNTPPVQGEVSVAEAAATMSAIMNECGTRKGGTNVTMRPFSVSLTDSPPPTYSQIFNCSSITTCTNAPSTTTTTTTIDHFNCTGTQLHLDSPDTNDTHYVNQVTDGGQVKTEGGC